MTTLAVPAEGLRSLPVSEPPNPFPRHPSGGPAPTERLVKPKSVLLEVFIPAHLASSLDPEEKKLCEIDAHITAVIDFGTGEPAITMKRSIKVGCYDAVMGMVDAAMRLRLQDSMPF